MQEQTKTGADLYRDWLRNTGRKGAWVAQQLGTTEDIVSMWRSERQRPTRAMAQALETLTDGAVPAASW